MDHFNALAVDRTVVLFLMPASGSKVTGSVPMSIAQALELSERLRDAALVAARTPMTGSEAIAECTGASSPDQLRLTGVL